MVDARTCEKSDTSATDSDVLKLWRTLMHLGRMTLSVKAVFRIIYKIFLYFFKLKSRPFLLLTSWSWQFKAEFSH
jgi:hypothetical protein